MKKRWIVAVCVTGVWSFFVIWISPRLLFSGIVLGAVVYFLTPFVQRWLEELLFTEFSSIASIWRQAIVQVQSGWHETQLPPLVSTDRCKACQSHLIASAQFCHLCGTVQHPDDAFLSCERCSSALPLNAQFCAQCRYPVTPNTEEHAFLLPKRTAFSQPLHAHRLVKDA